MYIIRPKRNITVVINIIIMFTLFFLLFCQKSDDRSIQLYDNSNLRLWYLEPAKTWTEALPIGNGRLGAMVFGDVHKERIQLNEESIWAGKPYNTNNPKALANLPKVRELIFNEEFEEAYKLATETLLGTPPRIRSYQTAGNVYIETDITDAIENYKRELILESGICKVTYKSGAITYTRELFASAVDDVIVIRLSSDTPNSINALIRLTRQKDTSVKSIRNNVLMMTGQIIDEADPQRGEGGAHMKFAACLLVKNSGGTISSRNNVLNLENVNEAIIFYNAATDYNLEKLNFDRNIDPVENAKKNVDKASAKEFEILEREHVKEHKSFLNRQKIELGITQNSELPTDERLFKFQQGEIDNDLIALYFQYGRYLLMNSSRKPGRLPANLQGIWNEHLQAPWNSDYHTNINLQMNYWPAEVCNLPETVELLTNFVDIHRVPGRVTAREMYNAGGWAMHHNTDIFGATSVRAGIHWGMSPLAGVWMNFPLWRHYEFTGDLEYLKNKAYPVMKETSEFVLDFLVEDENGYLVTTPSMSPENSYLDPKTGKRVQLTYAPTMDIQILNEHLERCIEAARILEDDDEYISRLENVLRKLPPVQIGRDGTIQEWIKDYEEHEPGHRHISHLLGLYPLYQITPETPELFTAAEKTIDRRLNNGGGHTGWSRAWIISFFARLLDSEKAYENVIALLQKSTLPNLFDTHPPFQIDGNFGGTAGIAEMLLQSHNNVINVLPALPEEWSYGKIHGLCARGGFDICIEWANGKLTNLEVISKLGNPCNLNYNGKETVFETKEHSNYRLNGSLELIK